MIRATAYVSILIAIQAVSIGADIYIPSQYPTIQAGIYAAANGDHVVLCPGVYTGPGNCDVNTAGKAITIRSLDPANAQIVSSTVIDVNYKASSAFKLTKGETQSTVIDGLTIKRANMYLIHMFRSRATISRCVLQECRNYYAAIWFDTGYPTPDPNIPVIVSDCVIRNCPIGIYIGGTAFEITNCTITETMRGIAASSDKGLGYIGNTIFRDNYDGAFEIHGEQTMVENCIVTGNTRISDTHYKQAGVVFSQSLNAVIRNCLITGNVGGYYARERRWLPVISARNNCKIENCTIAGNKAHDYIFTSRGGMIEIANCIIRDNKPSERYMSIDNRVFCSNIQGGPDAFTFKTSRPSVMDVDPCFVRPGYWDANSTPENTDDDYWVDGDYHLKSQGWRYDAQRGSWGWDDVTSRCVDAGCPASGLGEEPMSLSIDPQNRFGINTRIDMGYYGGTSEASMAPYGWTVLCDITNDGIVNGADIAMMTAVYNATIIPGDVNRDGVFDNLDLGLAAEQWLESTSWK